MSETRGNETEKFFNAGAECIVLDRSKRVPTTALIHRPANNLTPYIVVTGLKPGGTSWEYGKYFSDALEALKDFASWDEGKSEEIVSTVWQIRHAEKHMGDTMDGIIDEFDTLEAAEKVWAEEGYQLENEDALEETGSVLYGLCEITYKILKGFCEL